MLFSGVFEWLNFKFYASGGNTTEKAVEEGRYIKGDPLNGYYDFIITEGSYKFWVVFQVRAFDRKLETPTNSRNFFSNWAVSKLQIA